jgi:hypothetical protein
LRIELRDPPVVFAGRVGGDVSEGRGVGRPVEFIDVKVGGRDGGGGGGLGRIGSDGGDTLDLDAVFADDAGGSVHGGEGPGRTRGAFDIEEGDALAVGREGGRIDIAVEIGEAPGRVAVEMREIEVGLAAEIGAIGEEGEGGGVGRPGEVGFGAGAVGRGGGGDALAIAEVVEGGNENHATVEPGDALAVGGSGNLADGLGAPLAGKRLVEADGGGRGCGGLGANGQEGGCAEDERQGGAAEAARREWHRKNANSRKAGTRDVGTSG